jgi:hypothetical protein
VVPVNEGEVDDFVGRRLRRQLMKPATAKRPGIPAPTMGPGTPAGENVVSLKTKRPSLATVALENEFDMKNPEGSPGQAPVPALKQNTIAV